jgi:deoxyribonuclease-4
MNIGAHMSIAGGLHLSIERAVKSGFNCLQIFTQSPRLWKSKSISKNEIDLFIKQREKNKLKYVIVHAPYLPNLASPDETVLQKSIETVLYDLKIADAIKADYYVLHPGSHKKTSINGGINRLAASLCNIFQQYTPELNFLLETMPGAGSIIGSCFGELDLIINKTHEKVPDVKMGVCIDTAHIFAAGFDIRKENGIKKLVKEINENIGMKNVKVIHSNDSFEPLGSKKDRHNHIGKGEIGLKGFENMMKIPGFRKLPWILETPKTEDDSDIKNRKKLEKIFSKFIIHNS